MELQKTPKVTDGTVLTSREHILVKTVRNVVGSPAMIPDISTRLRGGHRLEILDFF